MEKTELGKINLRKYALKTAEDVNKYAKSMSLEDIILYKKLYTALEAIPKNGHIDIIKSIRPSGRERFIKLMTLIIATERLPYQLSFTEDFSKIIKR